jgi:hypothetical protein
MDREEAEEMLQGKFTPSETPAQLQDDGGEAENGIGLSRPLKAGLEALSGIDLSGVRVHHNSPKPAQLNALAYTQGQDIRVGPGQEKHLPHEGWHAVQQMQGRVQPTMQAKGVSINNDGDLEQEADLMGAKALQQHPARAKRPLARSKQPMASPQGSQPTIQRAMKFEFQTNNYIWQVDKRGRNPKPLGYRRGRSDRRKLGREGFSEDGSKPTFLAVGKQGYPEVRIGDMVKAKGKGIDETKSSQYIRTYRVTRDPRGEFTLGKERVNVTEVSRVDNSKVKGMRGKYNRGIYEFIYLDADNNDKIMNVHRDRTGNFQFGKIERMRKAKKADVEEGTAIELQLENHGILEFETPKWFRSWCALRLRIREAYAMTQAISNPSNNIDDERLENAINEKIGSLIEEGKRPSRYEEMGRLVEWPAEYPTDQLPRRVLRGGRLIIEIVDEEWRAKIQPSEGISLTQYESLLEEHRPSAAVRSIRYAKEILTEGKIDRVKAPNLYSFLQMIGHYIERGQIGQKKRVEERGEPPGPSKYTFPLMSRTSFSSIYSSLLTLEEQKLFAKLVDSKKILPAINKVNPDLDLKESSKFFKYGHGGVKNRPLKIIAWLKSIIDPKKYGRRIYNREEKRYEYKDLLSPPKSGSAAMGRFEVEKREGKKDTGLVKFELRSGPTLPAAGWEEYARKIFQKAAESRKRDDGTELIYEESEKCADTYFGHQKDKEEKKAEKKNKPTDDYLVVPKLSLTLGDETRLDFDAEFRYFLPTLLDGKLKPLIFAGAGTGGLSAGVGASSDPITDMSLFLGGKAGIRSDWFSSIEVGGGLEAGWIFEKSHSLRLGIGWEIWQRLDSDKKRTHLLNLFLGKSF